MDTQPPGSMGGTYAGNAIACAAAVATQRVIREEKLVENADAMGALLRRRLRAIDTRWGADGEAVVRDVRGMGCMVGLELHERFAPGSSKALAQACGARGLLLLNCSVYETVRFIPPSRYRRPRLRRRPISSPARSTRSCRRQRRREIDRRCR